MSADRRARIVRVRALQHSVARQRLVDAERALAGLASIAARLQALRCEHSVEPGLLSGLQLNAASEFATRLDRAAQGLTAPAAEAERVRLLRRDERVAASRIEDGTERIADRSRALAEAEAERRVDAGRAGRPTRRSPVWS